MIPVLALMSPHLVCSTVEAPAARWRTDNDRPEMVPVVNPLLYGALAQQQRNELMAEAAQVRASRVLPPTRFRRLRGLRAHWSKPARTQRWRAGTALRT